ncbi:MAG: FAD-dependent oxidoreductase, partial [Caldilineaceae bacterium]|nr:FAD-dependent oxidoreductase [Caldilineaceae bacterium]
MVTYSKQLPIIATPDVLVCGAGLAGIGAAVAAARGGAQVMVIERNGFAGGFFTAIIGSAFDGFVDERTGTPVVGGIVFEMLERMGVIQAGQGPHLRYNVNGDFSFVEMHPERVIPRCDPERFKRAADAILLEAGVQVLYHSQVADVITKTGRIESVIVSNKAGLVAIQPKIVIDCTGDGDVAAWAGAPFEKAEALQPMSLHFRIAYLEPSFDLRRRCAAVLQAAHERGELG